MHSQLFHPANNEDGYVSVICHRERYLKELLAMGWFETADEALAKRKSDTEEIVQQLLSGIGDAGTTQEEPLCHPVYEGDADQIAGCLVEPEMIAGNPEAPERHLTKAERKKLRLNK